ncbi:MAG: hypothetical protein CSB16_01940 [Clostridiales bacterium]|nr:MAG: hypothetical protein CSB16_01940 [Clostridiales bacterium]
MILGLDDQRKDILRSIEKNRLVSSILFSGAEGVGKKKLAISIAKKILCSTEYLEKLFDSGTLPDYLYVEEEKVIKVERIEEIINFSSIKPMYSDKKVVLINDAHKLNEYAQNKLLKTMEEAPLFLHIFLITHRPSLLLDTILSRVVEYSFKPIDKDIIFNSLDKSFDEDKRKIAAHFSSGSFKIAKEILEDDEKLKFLLVPKDIFSSIVKSDEFALFDLIMENSDSDEKALELIYNSKMWLRDIIMDSYSTYFMHRDILDMHKTFIDNEKLVKCLHLLDEAVIRINSSINARAVLINCFAKMYMEING